MRNKQSNSSIFNDLPEGVEIQINAKKNFFLLIFFSCWIAGWTVGEISVLEIVFKPPFSLSKLPLLIWLICWSLVGVIVILNWLWSLNGKEMIRIDEKMLTHKRVYTLFSRSQQYSMDHIENLRVSTKNVSMFKFDSGIRYWGLSGGIIEFDYKQGLYRFGSNLTEKQANSIVKQIKVRFSNI